MLPIASGVMVSLFVLVIVATVASRSRVASRFDPDIDDLIQKNKARWIPGMDKPDVKYFRMN